MLLIIKKDKYGIYNLVTGNVNSFLSIAKMIFELSGKEKNYL